MINYNKERYEYLKSRGICVTCGSEKAEPKRVRCLECLYKASESSIKSREKNIEKVRKKERERRKQKYREMRADGICSCGKKAIKGKSYCVECKIKAKRRYQEKTKEVVRREDFVYLNLCGICGSKELVENKKLCKRCYENSLKGLEIANQKRSIEKHIWRKINTVDLEKNRMRCV